MSCFVDPIAGLVAHLEATGCTSRSRRRVAGWGITQPVLASYLTAGELAAACRAAPAGAQDSIVTALLCVAAGDELAQLTVLSGLARRLGWVVGGWRRAGVAEVETAVVAADLVAAAWIVTSRMAEEVTRGIPVPDRVGLRLVDEAREMVRVPRRRERRIADLSVPLDRMPDTATPGDFVDEESLAAVIAGAVREGKLSRSLAAPVFMTRVAGFGVAETAERLRWSESMVRAMRWRAERRLAA